MVTVLGLLLAGDARAASGVSVGVPVELDMVGLAVGVHPEVLWSPFHPEGAFHLRGATGFMAGPELRLLPVSAGVREILFPTKRVRPGLGLGLQLQTFFPNYLPPESRLDLTMELTGDVRIAEGWRAGLQLSTEFGLVGGFGLGMAVRAGVERDLPF